MAATGVRIVAPDTLRTRPDGTEGEIWVRGPGVASGYWARPEATAATFGARPTDAPGTGPYLRTGDLGLLRDGELYVTGRIKDLLIVHGRNHYPQDVEEAVWNADPVCGPAAPPPSTPARRRATAPAWSRSPSTTARRRGRRGRRRRPPRRHPRLRPAPVRARPPAQAHRPQDQRGQDPPERGPGSLPARRARRDRARHRPRPAGSLG
ncbi:AMP-binding protein [Streptomyces stramineus]